MRAEFSIFIISQIAGAQFANLLQAGEINLVVHLGNKGRIYQLLSEGTAELAITASAPGPENFIYLVCRKGALKHPRVSYAKDILLAFANINKYASATST